MKIVQVLATSGGVGGLEQHTFNLVNEMSLQHEVHMIAHPCYAEKFNQHVHFHPLDFARSRWNIFLLWQLKSLIQQIQPDIVHAQAGKAAELISRIRPFLANLKVVTTVHGTKKNKSAYLVGDAVIAVSKALTQGIPAEKAHIVYNGVHTQPSLTDAEKQVLKADIDKKFPALDAGKKNVMCIGRLEPVKNIALLIQAMQSVDANLYIVGDGSLRQALEQQVTALNMRNRVAFLGFRTDARNLLQLADVVVLSSDREGFPLVMVEALQADKVMAATKVNGVIEWLPEAYLADIGDVQGLQHAIQNALNAHAQQDFQPLFAQAKAELTVAAMTQQTLKIYEHLLKA
ncbi:glycosyl transferase [Acinetobacter sp. ANC 4169]|jgi:glycosyltransferase involved in cell wall biosynthesis|uniref:glycosyltransferase n=1 Tax=Acinetobacter sp. ANC 4169 TaxID=1977879 RepID=UPI000A342594|nr:glycosyltransferase [Acinetobacter sp. ANC 4169]OTG71930.1 glycosyl transferase [Acinetobacter sp. ANC 4169]